MAKSKVSVLTFLIKKLNAYISVYFIEIVIKLFSCYKFLELEQNGTFQKYINSSFPL